ncbi:MAG: outer membrane protein assembly factor BamA [Proteobacteria bacterium]|nr:outer membrane protein assembly factor BamA [Pseudomonadota bacterium]MBU4503418.1 outer membrane protein assembly factor BamA [Pseudomonadota bacterium]
MQRSLNLLLMAIILFLPAKVYSLETVRVLVLPFEIHSQQELSYLKTEIPGIFKNHFKQNGAIVIEIDFSLENQPKSIAGMRNLGIKSGADYVVWGSLTWLEQKFSIDAKMIESFNNKPPNILFVEGEGIENLFGSVKKLSEELGIKIFKHEKIAAVLVEGNKRIETDAIKKYIKTKPGDSFNTKNISEDLKSVYSMGYFEDIRIKSEDKPEGKTIIFIVKEKPTIRVINLKGNTVYDDDEIKEYLNIRTGSILNIFKINSNIRRIEELYKEKNYHNIKVDYDLKQLEHNQADLEFIIEEGEKVQIKKITFEGNNAFDSDKLKGLIKTSEKGFFSWLTSSGELNIEDLNQDVARLSAFYHNNGYIQARVGEPQIEYKGKWIYITIKTDEGPRFKVGEVDIEGDIVLSKEELAKKLKINKEEFFNREVVRNDVLALTDIYSDEGYAYAEITPRIDKNFDQLIVNICYVIKKGQQVFFEKIIIAGNTKTRDKVIRRELKVYEQELFSGRQLKRGMRNLHRLDFFEDIKVNTIKGSSDDKMILKIDVSEKPTGTFSFGGGYSSVENLFLMASISQRNLFGRGQILNLKGEIGGRTNKYTLSFTEPWLFDIPLSATFDLYNWDRDYDSYDKNSIGSSVRFGYPVFDFTRLYLSYKYEIGDVSNIEADASESIWEMEGENVLSSISTTLRYDSRDRIFNPTEGQNHSVSMEYAGIGGDIGFTKYLAETGWYIPMFWGTVGFMHGETGYVKESSGEKLPDYERFYLGGMNSMRGFDWQDIHVTDEDGAEIGGETYIQFNIEFIFPLIKKAGIVGVIFYDTGNVYGSNESIELGDMRKSAGFGFRWYSPIGPIRLENGYILDPEEGEDTGGRWDFTMGAAF